MDVECEVGKNGKSKIKKETKREKISLLISPLMNMCRDNVALCFFLIFDSFDRFNVGIFIRCNLQGSSFEGVIPYCNRP